AAAARCRDMRRGEAKAEEDDVNGERDGYNVRTGGDNDGGDDDDHCDYGVGGGDRGDYEETDIPLRLKSTTNFGLPWGQLRPERRRPSAQHAGRSGGAGELPHVSAAS